MPVTNTTNGRAIYFDKGEGEMAARIRMETGATTAAGFTVPKEEYPY